MFLLANFAAGLVIYWAWNNMLSILQQTVIMKRMGTFENPLGRIGLPAFVRNALPAGFGAGAGSGTVSVSPDAEGDEAESASDPFLGEEGDVLTARDDEPDDEADDEVSPKNESD
jgi:membrane protein insertase Oxa1/YidC/SpoIIIJ